MYTIPITFLSKRASFAQHNILCSVDLQWVVISSLEAWSWREMFVAVAHNNLPGGEPITFWWELFFIVPWSTVKMFPKAKAYSHHWLLAHSLIQGAPAVCHKGQSSFWFVCSLFRVTETRLSQRWEFQKYLGGFCHWKYMFVSSICLLLGRTGGCSLLRYFVTPHTIVCKCVFIWCLHQIRKVSKAHASLSDLWLLNLHFYTYNTTNCCLTYTETIK